MKWISKKAEFGFFATYGGRSFIKRLRNGCQRCKIPAIWEFFKGHLG